MEKNSLSVCEVTNNIFLRLVSSICALVICDTFTPTMLIWTMACFFEKSSLFGKVWMSGEIARGHMWKKVEFKVLTEIDERTLQLLVSIYKNN